MAVAINTLKSYIRIQIIYSSKCFPRATGHGQRPNYSNVCANFTQACDCLLSWAIKQYVEHLETQVFTTRSKHNPNSRIKSTLMELELWSFVQIYRFRDRDSNQWPLNGLGNFTNHAAT